MTLIILDIESYNAQVSTIRTLTDLLANEQPALAQYDWYQTWRTATASLIKTLTDALATQLIGLTEATTDETAMYKVESVWAALGKYAYTHDPKPLLDLTYEVKTLTKGREGAVVA